MFNAWQFSVPRVGVPENSCQLVRIDGIEVVGLLARQLTGRMVYGEIELKTTSEI